MKTNILQITKQILAAMILATTVIIANPISADATSYGYLPTDHIADHFGVAYAQFTEAGNRVYVESGIAGNEVNDILNGINQIPANALQAADAKCVAVYLLSPATFENAYAYLHGYTNQYTSGLSCIAKRQGVYQSIVLLKAGRSIRYDHLTVHEIGHAIDGSNYDYSNYVFPTYQNHIHTVASFDPGQNGPEHVCYSNEFFAEAFNYWVFEKDNMKENAYDLYVYMNDIFGYVSEEQVAYEQPEEIIVEETVIEEVQVQETVIEEVKEEVVTPTVTTTEKSVEETSETAITEEDIEDVEIKEEKLTDEAFLEKVNSVLGYQTTIADWETDYNDTIRQQEDHIEEVNNMIESWETTYDTWYERLFHWLGLI